MSVSFTPKLQSEAEGTAYASPKASEIRRIQLRSNRVITGDLLGQYRSAFRGTGLVFTDIREYQPGDDVKHIHWTATARTGVVYVKSYEEDRQLQVVIAVDSSASMRAPLSFQAYRKALDFSALVAGLTQRGNDLLGLCLFADTVIRFMPPKSGARRQQQVLSALVGQAASKTSTDLNPVISHLRCNLRRPGIVFLVSDFFCAPFEEELKMLAARHDVILVHVEPQIESLPNAGLVTFTDAESGSTHVLDTTDARVRSEWTRVLRTRRQTLIEIAHRCRVDHIVIGDSVSQPLVRLMRERALRTRR